MAISTGGTPAVAPAQLHNTDDSPISHWPFDGTLVDEQGVDNVSNVSGVERYGPNAIPGPGRALFCDGVSKFTGTNPAVGEQITSANAGGDPSHVIPNRWHHIAFTRDASGGPGSVVGKCFINGQLASTLSTMTTATGGGNAEMSVGAPNDTGRNYTGLLSSLIVYNSVRTDPQILTDARLTLPPDLRP